MLQPRAYHVTPQEIGTLLVLAREQRGLSRLSAARLIETDQSNLRKAEMNSERHLFYAVDMLDRYARLDPSDDAFSGARVNITAPIQLSALVDAMREPARAPLRDHAVHILSGVDGIKIDVDDPSMFHAYYGSSRFTIYLDQRTAMMMRSDGRPFKLSNNRDASDEKIVSTIMNKISP